MTRLVYVLFSVVVVVSMLFVPAVANELTVIELAEEAWVTGNDIFLNDVATFVGEQDLVEQLSQVNIGRAPVAGHDRKLTRGHIEVRLRQAGINPRTLEFKGASSVQVYTGVAATQTTEAETYYVVTATREIDRLDIINAEDLQQEERPVQGTMRDAGQVSDFIGLRATRRIPAGNVVTAAAVEVIPTIERGDQVWIVAGTGAIQVTVSGVARQSGGIGEIIPVENSASRQVVHGEIVDDNTVFVNVKGGGAQ